MPTFAAPATGRSHLLDVIPLLSVGVILHMAAKALRCPLAVAGSASESAVVLVVCLTGWSNGRDSQHSAGVLCMQPGTVISKLNMPQRRSVVGGRQEIGFRGCRKRQPRDDTDEIGGPFGQVDCWASIVVAVAAGNIDGLALMEGVASVTHKANACVAIDTTHASQIVHIGWHLLDVPAVRQSQTATVTRPCSGVDLRQSRKTE